MSVCWQYDFSRLAYTYYLVTIMEETLTSGKYISLFLISILYIYKIKKITWRPTYLLKK